MKLSRFLFLLGAVSLFFSGTAIAETPSWIWTSNSPAEREVVYVRKEFSVPADTKRALLFVAADNGYDAYINGGRRPASRGADWNRPNVTDVTDMLKRGEPNVLAIRAKNEGGAAGVIALLEITNIADEKTTIVSGDDWKIASKAPKGWNNRNAGEDPYGWSKASIVAVLGEVPWGKVDEKRLAAALDVRTPEATPEDRIKMLSGFDVELIYSVPKSDQGSWVAMTMDGKGRLIVSDQYGWLYRLPIPAPGEMVSDNDVEKIDLDIGGAQGLLYAFDALYVVLNSAEHGGRGLYRLRDTDGDDKFDEKKLLRKFDDVGGEHGPHAVLLGPDGESLYIVVGNQTPVTKVDSSRVPEVWGEDLLLERPIGRGFMKGTLAPGGWIAKTDPDGKKWELVATGFRNQYDAAFHSSRDLFTYDADMEWDMNTPWYRPTRVNVVPSGAEFGWRNGGGKWPAYYPDSLPAVVNIGPGSPTGVAFGYGAKFPAKYQNALYVADWSYGKLYAVHLEPKGSSWKAEFEEFMSAQPLPLTDLLVNPEDGAMYITIGGRRVQSGLYRVTYSGKESTEPAEAQEPNELHSLREEIESFHRPDKAALDAVWPHLGRDDRFVRYAARIAVEHQPVTDWKERALSEKNTEAAINVLIALARHGKKEWQGDLLAALDRIEMSDLKRRQKLDLLRAYSLAFTRLGEGTPEVRESLAKKLVRAMPFRDPAIDAEALQLAVYLGAPEAAKIGVELLESAPSQEEQMAYAKSLRHQKSGWTRDDRKAFFEWLTRAKAYKGGASFGLFIENMKQTALENTPESEQVALKETLEAEPPSEQVFTAEPREFVQGWTVADFDDVINVGLEGNRDFVNGRKMFGAASCFACHRFNQEGGAIGPDLTSVAGKFSPRDLLESIIEPGKEISDQYGQMIFEMKDGTVVTGRIMNLSGDVVKVNTNMMNPNDIAEVDRKQLKEMTPSPISMMPPSLLNTLSKDDVLDLLAYLLSKGNPEDPMFAE